MLDHSDNFNHTSNFENSLLMDGFNTESLNGFFERGHQNSDESKYFSPNEDPEKVAEFSKFLLANFVGANSKNLCVQCWCLCNRYQMNKHKDLGHRLLTPKYFKDIEAFINLAN